MAVVFSDSFTVGADTALEAYPSGSPDYAAVYGGNNLDVIAATGRVTGSVTSDNSYRIIDAAAPTGDQKITLTCGVRTGYDGGHAKVRCTTNNGYLFQRASATTFELYRLASGGYSLLTTYSVSTANNSALSISLKAVGSGATVTITPTVSGTDLASYADTAGTRLLNGTPGVHFYQADAGVNAANYIDNISVDDLSASGIAGVVAGSVGPVSGTVTAGLRVAGSVSATVGAVTGGITGTVPAAGISGAVAGALSAVTGVATGAVLVQAGVAAAVGSVTGAISAASSVQGGIAAAMGPIAGTLAAQSRVAASVAGVLGDVAGAVAGVARVQAVVAGALPAITGVTTAAARVAAGVAGALDPVVGGITGTVGNGITGTVAGALADVQGGIAAAVRVQCAVVAALHEVQPGAAATVRVAGAVAAPLGAVGGAISGAVGGGRTAEVSGAVGEVSGAVQASVRVAASVSAGIGPITGGITASAGGAISGAVAGQVAAVSGAVAGRVDIAASLGAPLAPIAGAIVAVVGERQAQVVGALGPVVGAIYANTGAVAPTGTLAEQMLALYVAAELAVLGGKEARLGDRTIKHEDLSQIRAGRQEWQGRVQQERARAAGVPMIAGLAYAVARLDGQ